MKITIEDKKGFRISEYVAMTDEGIRMKQQAEEAEAERKLKKTETKFFDYLEDAADALVKTQTRAVEKPADEGASSSAAKGTLDGLFDEASDKYNVDKQLLLAVAMTESGFDRKATSKSGAMGIMQLMPETAKDLGVQDAYDPEDNIMGGAKLLSILLKKYNGDREKALAAYNAGSGTVDRAGGVPDSIRGYVNKVLGYYNAKVQAPDAKKSDAKDTKKDEDAGADDISAREIKKTAKEIKTAFSKFPEYQSYEMFLQELEKEMENDSKPSSAEDAYKMMMQDAKNAISKVIHAIE